MKLEVDTLPGRINKTSSRHDPTHSGGSSSCSLTNTKDYSKLDISGSQEEVPRLCINATVSKGYSQLEIPGTHSKVEGGPWDSDVTERRLSSHNLQKGHGSHLSVPGSGDSRREVGKGYSCLDLVENQAPQGYARLDVDAIEGGPEMPRSVPGNTGYSILDVEQISSEPRGT